MFCLSLFVTVAAVSTAHAEQEVRVQFLALAAKQDRAAVVALWTAHPEAVLQTIDADLEGSLDARERSGGSPDTKAIAAMHARALWGAEVAWEVTGDPMILDYVASFVGWDAGQRKRFREGQAAFKASMRALKDGDAKAAFTAGQQCLDRASSLGDWWGTAMGYDALHAAHKALSEHEAALESAARARAIYHSLGLLGDEYAAATSMTELCLQMRRIDRGQAACRVALGLARKLNDTDGEKTLLGLQSKLGNLAKPAGK